MSQLLDSLCIHALIDFSICYLVASKERPASTNDFDKPSLTSFTSMLKLSEMVFLGCLPYLDYLLYILVVCLRSLVSRDKITLVCQLLMLIFIILTLIIWRNLLLALYRPTRQENFQNHQDLGHPKQLKIWMKEKLCWSSFWNGVFECSFITSFSCIFIVVQLPFKISTGNRVPLT